MNQYMLSVHAGGEDAQPTSQPTPDEMQAYMQQIADLEQEMDDAGVFVFGGALKGPESSAVARGDSARVVDGPFIETKEHLAGFYLINAPDVGAAHEWATRVSSVVGKPIEVRPFAATGRVQVG